MILQQVELATPDGKVDAQLARPATNERLPGVIVLTDIFGLRPAYEDMIQRIADHGYVVLAPNIFYRTRKPPIFDFVPDFQSERTTNRMKEITTPLNLEASIRDGSAFVDFLAAQPSVSEGPMGVVGFCLTGKFAIRLAEARADRIGAAASFHGAGIVTDAADSPHLVLPRIQAELYFGHAENDRSMPPEAIERLEHALRSWGGQYESETYSAGHGWMISGRDVHNPEQAERGFNKLMELLDRALKSPVGAS